MNKNVVAFIERLSALSAAHGDDACWPWPLAKRCDGYGQVTCGGKTWKAHRLSYEIANGPITDGKQLDHLCRRRDCVNPRHVEPVSQRENIMRSPIALAAINARKTACNRGHSFDAANTYAYPGHRICKQCTSERAAAWYLTHRKAIKERLSS